MNNADERDHSEEAYNLATMRDETELDEPEYITVTPSPEMRAAVLAAAGLPDLAAALAETTDARNWRILRECITGKIAHFEQAAADWPTLDYKQWAEGLRHALIMMDGFEGKPLSALLAEHTAAACDAITTASQA